MMDHLFTLGIEGFKSSEELLGAYLENNLPVVENLKIKQFVSEHPELGNIIDDINLTEIDWDAQFDENILSQFELPNIVNLDNEIIESSKDKIIDNKRKL